MLLLLAFSLLLIPRYVLGQFSNCSIGDNWGNLASAFAGASAFSTLGYFELTGTISVQTGGNCPTSFRAYQTIEAGTLNCFAAPVEVTVGPDTNVETVTYIYEGCPVATATLAPTITVNESHWIETDSEGGSVFGFTTSVVVLGSQSTSSTSSSTSDSTTSSSSAQPGSSSSSSTPTSTASTISSTSSTTSTSSSTGNTMSTITTAVLVVTTSGAGGGTASVTSSTSLPKTIATSDSASSMQYCKHAALSLMFIVGTALVFL